MSVSGRLSGKVAVVTGAASGFGPILRAPSSPASPLKAMAGDVFEALVKTVILASPAPMDG